MADKPDEPRAFSVEGDQRVPVGPGHDAAGSNFDPTRLDFGHYAGHSIEELAEIDPDYLQWLQRHPSGVRYRNEIQRVLGVVRRSLEWHG